MLGKIFFLHKHCLAYKVSTHILLKYITKYFNQILQQTTPSARALHPETALISAHHKMLIACH